MSVSMGTQIHYLQEHPLPYCVYMQRYELSISNSKALMIRWFCSGKGEKVYIFIVINCERAGRFSHQEEQSPTGVWSNTANRAPWRATSTSFTPTVCMSFQLIILSEFNTQNRLEIFAFHTEYIQLPSLIEPL